MVRSKITGEKLECCEDTPPASGRGRRGARRGRGRGRGSLPNSPRYQLDDGGEEEVALHDIPTAAGPAVRTRNDVCADLDVTADSAVGAVGGASPTVSEVDIDEGMSEMLSDILANEIAKE